MKNFIIALLLLFAQSLYSQSLIEIQKYKTFIQKYSGLIAEEMIKHNVKGLSISVVDNDNIVWSEGFGNYSSNNIAVNNRTQFLIGSITKVFTCISIMQLHEKGLIDIDDSYKKYVPEFNMKSRFGDIKEITIRQMLTHHAGIPDILKNKFPSEYIDFKKVLDYVNTEYATFAPNTVYSYSNAGISLLGNLIEVVSGITYSEYLQKYIFNPLDMNETGLYTYNNKPQSAYLGYSADGTEKYEIPLTDVPAGAIYSTALDMAKFIRAMLRDYSENKNLFLQQKSIIEMSNLQNLLIPLDYSEKTGLVWQILYNGAGKCIAHDGGTIYHRAEICIAPESGLGIFIMSNSANGGKITWHADCEMMGELAQIKSIKPESLSNLENRKFKKSFSYVGNEEFKTISLTANKLKEIAGLYGTFGNYSEILVKDSVLFIEMQGNGFYFLPVENELYLMSTTINIKGAIPDMRFYFDSVNNSKILIQIDRWGNQFILGEKIEVLKLSKTWQNRIGSYDLVKDKNSYELFSNFRLEIEDSILVLKADFNAEMGFPNPVIPLKIINENLAVVYGYGIYSGQAVQFFDTKKMNRFQFMGVECKKMK